MDCRIRTNKKPLVAVATDSGLRAHLAVTGALLLCLSPGCLLPSAAAAGIYKSIDSEGNIVFTDQPSDDAEAIDNHAKKQRASSSNSEAVPIPSEDNELDDEDDEDYEPAQPATTLLVAPDPTNPPKPEPETTPEPSVFLPINRVEILTPEHDTTFIDPLGQIWVEVQSYPTPMSESGLIAQLWMDDTLITSDNATQLRLPPPARGTHVLHIKLIDRQGRLVKTSHAVHIHVKYRSAKQ